MKPERFYPRPMKRAESPQAALDAMKSALLELTALECNCEETPEKAYTCPRHHAQWLLEEALECVGRVKR